MEERSLCMREAPGSIPGFSNLVLIMNVHCLPSKDSDKREMLVSSTLRNNGFNILGSIVVSIPACHAGDRGSIPRRGAKTLAI